MENMMKSIAKYITANSAAFGLTSPDDLELIEHPTTTLPDNSRRLVVLALRTMPDATRRVPFNNLIASGTKAQRFQTQVELECKTKGPAGQDFYWNEARKFRDQVYAQLAGPSKGGIIIPRFDYTDPANPVQAGEIWFEVSPETGYPIEDQVEDQNDPSIKSVFLTYMVRWWRPA